MCVAAGAAQRGLARTQGCVSDGMVFVVMIAVWAATSSAMCTGSVRNDGGTHKTGVDGVNYKTARLSCASGLR